jgi:transposase-like protein
MDRRFLGECLQNGLSLEAIGKATGRHPSTVSYWLKKHGLRAHGASRHAPKGTADERRLRELVTAGGTVRSIAAELGLGYSTVRYWLRRLGLETKRTPRRRAGIEAHRAGLEAAVLDCPTHGRTEFRARSDGAYRCAKCASAAVSRRRRRIKRELVEGAGGRCQICGFYEHPAALQFHHLDPQKKDFHLASGGLTRSLARIRKEAEKCVLLCANCHALVEAGIKEAPMA